MCKQAWDKVRPETIKNCFKKAGFVKTDEESVGATEAEAVPPVDSWEDVVSNSTISYEDFLNVDEDVAVCGEMTDAEIIAEVLGNEKQDDDADGLGDEIAGSSAEEVPVPSAADAMNHVQELRRFFESRINVSDSYFNSLNMLESFITAERLNLRKQAKISSFFEKQ